MCAALVRCLLCIKRSCLKRRAPAARCAGWDISAARVRCAAFRLCCSLCSRCRSCSGVYGDHGGAWVDEDTPLRVTPAAGKPWLRAQAEAAWRELQTQHALPLHVFRLGGIYGASRQRASRVLPAQRLKLPCCAQGRAGAYLRRGAAGQTAAALRSGRVVTSATSRVATWRTSWPRCWPAWMRPRPGTQLHAVGLARDRADKTVR